MSAHIGPPRVPDRHSPIAAGDPDVVRSARSTRSEGRGPKAAEDQAACSNEQKTSQRTLSLSLSLSLSLTDWLTDFNWLKELRTDQKPDLIWCLTTSSWRWRWRSHSSRCWNMLFIDVALMTRSSRGWCLCRMLLWGWSWCWTVCWSGCKHVAVRLEDVAGPDRSAGSVLLSQVFDRWCSQRCLVLRSCVDLRSPCYALDVGGWSLYPSVVVGSGTWSWPQQAYTGSAYIPFLPPPLRKPSH